MHLHLSDPFFVFVCLNACVGLFRRHGSMYELAALRQALEAGKDVPEHTDPHIAVQCLLQWLYDLEGVMLLYCPVWCDRFLNYCHLP